MLIPITSLLGVLVVAFAVLVAVMRFRRRRAARKVENAQTDFAIDELHRLMVEGKLNREEFEKARASVLSRRKSEPADGRPSRGFEVLEPRDPV